MALADRMAVIGNGVVRQIGTPVALYDYPGDSFMAGFVGDANLLSGTIERINGDMLRFCTPLLQALYLPNHVDARVGPCMIGFRPHAIRIDVGDAQRDGALVWLDGQVESSEFFGPLTRYRVRVDQMLIVADQMHYAGLAPFPVGMAVGLGIAASQLRFLPL